MRFLGWGDALDALVTARYRGAVRRAADGTSAMSTWTATHVVPERPQTSPASIGGVQPRPVFDPPTCSLCAAPWADHEKDEYGYVNADACVKLMRKQRDAFAPKEKP